jgi:hypothetical protein
MSRVDEALKEFSKDDLMDAAEVYARHAAYHMAAVAHHLEHAAGARIPSDSLAKLAIVYELSEELTKALKVH